MITFFSMPGCSYCQASKTMLEKEIKGGLVKVKPHTKAPQGVPGFPHFINNSNNKEMSGKPRTKSELFQRLGMSTEAYPGSGECAAANSYVADVPWPTRDCAQSPHWPGTCTPYTYGWWKAGVL